jgi:hypothetical protein
MNDFVPPMFQGFPEHRAKNALRATHDCGTEAALQWLLENEGTTALDEAQLSGSHFVGDERCVLNSSPLIRSVNMTSSLYSSVKVLESKYCYVMQEGWTVRQVGKGPCGLDREYLGGPLLWDIQQNLASQLSILTVVRRPVGQ